MAQNRIFTLPDTPLTDPDFDFPGQQLYTYALGYSKLIVNQIQHDSNVEN